MFQELVYIYIYNRHKGRGRNTLAVTLSGNVSIIISIYILNGKLQNEINNASIIFLHILHIIFIFHIQINHIFIHISSRLSNQNSRLLGCHFCNLYFSLPVLNACNQLLISVLLFHKLYWIGHAHHLIL